MATEKQINANRQNASKSTGPQTPKGKTVVAQNALKHGLTSSQNLIKGESRDDFDLHSDQLIEEFNPKTPIENHLVQRIVTLTWRLNRVNRAQTAALNSLHHSHRNRHPSPLAGLGARFAPKSDSLPPPDHEFGDVTVKDSSKSRVIDNLLLQERRLENSLFRTIAELERKQLIRKIDLETTNK
ncbi:MAG: hypothetical protein FVQ79_14370 [Planctomycetes bacterium]|nr:hypothetical protein [Planctomycetota bacterium]